MKSLHKLSQDGPELHRKSLAGGGENQTRGQLVGRPAHKLLRLPGHFRAAAHLVTSVAGELALPEHGADNTTACKARARVTRTLVSAALRLCFAGAGTS